MDSLWIQQLVFNVFVNIHDKFTIKTEAISLWLYVVSLFHCGACDVACLINRDLHFNCGFVRASWTFKVNPFPGTPVAAVIHKV